MAEDLIAARGARQRVDVERDRAAPVVYNGVHDPLAWGPAQRRVAWTRQIGEIGAEERVVGWWDVGGASHEVVLPEPAVTALHVLPDGRLLAIGGVPWLIDPVAHGLARVDVKVVAGRR